MRDRRVLMLLAVIAVFWFAPSLRADWKSDWERVGAAAKKDGPRSELRGMLRLKFNGPGHPHRR